MLDLDRNHHRSVLPRTATRIVIAAAAAASLFSLAACSETSELNQADSLRADSASQAPVAHHASEVESPELPAEAALILTVPPRGRLGIEHAEISGRSDVALMLTIEDEGSPLKSRKARIVAVVGKRFDGEAMPIAEEPNRFILRVPAAFLEVGLYMIEVDAVDSHPIDMRRFVVEVLP